MLVSVIMPTYNCGRFIEETILSVLAQTISDWELIIVDDCSTDNTYEILKPYLEKHSNIHYYCLEENGGPDVARTEAIKHAIGKYVAFLDSDDLWHPNKLEKQIEFMESTGVDFSCTAYSQINEQGMSLQTACYPPLKTDYKKMLRLADPIGNLTVMYNQESLGKYEVPRIKKRNDFALWLKILKDAPYCAGMQEVLATYRIRNNSVSSNKLKLIRFHWQLYRKIEKLSVIKSVYAILCWAIVKSTGLGLHRVKYIDET